MALDRGRDLSQRPQPLLQVTRVRYATCRTASQSRKTFRTAESLRRGGGGQGTWHESWRVCAERCTCGLTIGPAMLCDSLRGCVHEVR